MTKTNLEDLGSQDLATSTEINFEEIQNSVLETERKEKEVEGYSFVFATKNESNEIKMDFQIAKEMFEKEFIVHALKLNRGKINQTALKANIPKKTLLRKIEKYEITPKDFY